MTHKSIGSQIASPRSQASPIFTLFGVYIIHGSARPAKTGKGLGAFIRSMMSGGHKLDVRGEQLPKQHIGSSIRVLYCSFRLQTLAPS